MAAKRDLVFGKLRAMPGLQLPDQPPSGAFYLLPDVGSFYGRTSAKGASLSGSTALCVALLAETGVALVPGDAFGAPQCVRLSYAAATADLELACGRLGAFLAATVKPPKKAPPPKP
jgi:aspartate/methionine/tyrosine aminotransferase